MAKLTRHGGPTVGSAHGRALLPGVALQVVECDAVAGAFGDDVVGVVLGGFLPPQGDEVDLPPIEEDTCPGNNSPTSHVKPPKSDEPQKGSRRKRAPTTESPSPRGRAGSSSASSTATSGPATDA